MKTCIDYLQHLFKDRLVYDKDITTDSFPRFLLDKYVFFTFSLHQQGSYILVKGKEKDLISPRKISKQMIQLYHLTNRTPVFVFDELRLSQRNALIEANIPFVQPNYQIYLPTIIINLIEKEFIQKEYTQTFSTSTQVIFIYLFLNNIIETNARRLSEVLPYSIATTNRALSELVNKKLIYTEGSNTRKKYKVIDRKLFWETGKNYLFNPVINSYYTLNQELCTNLPKSNETALYSYDSNLYETEASYYAISNSQMAKLDKKLFVHYYDIIDQPYYVIEKFKYDPKILSKVNTIDIISLYAQLKDSEDERILIELDDILEEILCYQLPD